MGFNITRGWLHNVDRASGGGVETVNFFVEILVVCGTFVTF